MPPRDPRRRWIGKEGERPRPHGPRHDERLATESASKSLVSLQVTRAVCVSDKMTGVVKG